MGNSGDGGAAAAAGMHFPSSVSVDMGGNVYIADQGNNNIRVVNTMGIISHFAGTSTSGYDGDGGPAVSAKLGAPKAVYADGWGRIYVADYSNHVVRVIKAGSSTALLTSKAIGIYPNPSKGCFTISLPANAQNATISLSDLTGRVVATKTVVNATQNSVLNFGILAQGNYVVRVVTEGDIYVARAVIE